MAKNSQYNPLKMTPSDRNRTYNNVCWAMAHDSHTATENVDNFSGVDFSTDQTWTVEFQLKSGIRAVRISTGIDISELTAEKRILTHHGNPATVGKTYWTLKKYLTYVRDFLRANPTEIVTIFDEGDGEDFGLANLPGIDKTYENDLAEVYANVFGGTTKSPNLLFNPSSPYWSDKSVSLDNMRNGGWPTLQQLIDADQRLILFMTNGYPRYDHNWILNAYGKTNKKDAPNQDKALVVSSPYDYQANPDLDVRPADISMAWRGGWGNQPQLNLLQHFFYNLKGHLGSQEIEESWQRFSKWTVGDLLVQDCITSLLTGNFPHFINVDFFQGVWGARSYLMPFVNALNEAVKSLGNLPDAPTSGGVVSVITDAVLGIHIQDTSREDINALDDKRTTYSQQHLCHGGTYTVKSVSTGEYITLDFSNALPNENMWLDLQTTPPNAINGTYRNFRLMYQYVCDGWIYMRPTYGLILMDPIATNFNYASYAISTSAGIRLGRDNRQDGIFGLEIRWVAEGQWVIRVAGQPDLYLTRTDDKKLMFLKGEKHAKNAPMNQRWCFMPEGAQPSEFLPAPAPKLPA